jgi:hypothetical protein
MPFVRKTLPLLHARTTLMGMLTPNSSLPSQVFAREVLKPAGKLEGHNALAPDLFDTREPVRHGSM